MNLGRNAVAPSDFSLPHLPRNVDIVRVDNFNGRIPDNTAINGPAASPSYYLPHVTVTAPAAAAASTTSSSLLTTVTALIFVVIIVGGIAAVVVVVQTSSQQSCSGFTCTSDGTCLSSTAECNGVSECDDGQDESGCSSANIAIDEQYSCIGSTTVINKANVCDGVEDCPGGTDEDRCIISPDADDGGDVKVFSVSTETYYKICGYADGWTDAKSDTVCGILGCQSSGSMNEEAVDSTPGVSSNGSFSLNAMVQQTPAACTNNRVMRIFCETCCDPSRSSRIVGGGDATVTEHSWQVSLQSNRRAFCGGSIVGARWVVTAAHCVQGLTSFSHIHVVAGITSLTESLDSDKEYDIQAITTHPLYSSTTLYMDVAMIKISSDFAFSSTIGEICLPLPGRKYENLATVVASGWGATAYQGSSSAILQAVNVNLYSDCVASSSYSQSSILAGMVCAGVSGGGKDSCQGDSGGPLAITLSNVSYLVGATSWGYQCAVSGYPGVYAEISYARSWIDRIMS